MYDAPVVEMRTVFDRCDGYKRSRILLSDPAVGGLASGVRTC